MESSKSAKSIRIFDAVWGFFGGTISFMALKSTEGTGAFVIGIVIFVVWIIAVVSLAIMNSKIDDLERESAYLEGKHAGIKKMAEEYEKLESEIKKEKK